MKYSNENIVTAKYGKEQGNPFLEALPDLMGKSEFVDKMRSDPRFTCDLRDQKPQERRSYLTELTTWFQPMDYMYSIYDMLYQSMATTYQTKTTIEFVKQLNEIHMDFRTGKERTIPYATQAFSGAILGVPGIGKTSTIKRCLSTMPQVIVHTEYKGKSMYSKQINYLVVECPSDCSVKTLAFNIISGIDRAIGSEYIKHGNTLLSLSASALTTKLKIVCMNHHIGVIVIDEIQNAIITASRNKQMKPLIKFLVELTNETSTSICFCGTLEAEEVFLKQEHLKRRTRGLRLHPMKYDHTYRKFIMDLWAHQVTLQKSLLTEKLMKQIYDLSGGIPAYIVKIFQEAQTQAILSGTEKLSYGVIKQAVSYLGIEVPKNYSRGGTSISDFSICEVELKGIGMEEDFEEPETDYPVFEEPVSESQRPVLTVLPVAMENEPNLPVKPSNEPVRRFYATKRGRPTAERDKADLLTIWRDNEAAEHLITTLTDYAMIERRCI